MNAVASQEQGTTYCNPVYAGNCADPFVLKYLNEYWCYCTGWWHDGRCFGVFHSRDLQNWREVGGAMTPYDPTASCYWAPEVIYQNGRFLLYYSVGNEEHMQIRVAEAAHPAGPFSDCGVRLTHEDFAIDPHVFTDNEGVRYLFYATDFLAHQYIGTGTVCDRMVTALQLAGEPRPVTRARFDWQVYDPQRTAKGGVRWHTVEGPFVLEHKGRYYQMFSGGNWQNATYGTSYAVSESVWMDEEWNQVADGQRVLPVLRTMPEINGPGHNSVVRGPDNLQLFCVYHFWQPPHRVMAIDRLDWVGERLIVLGPTITPQVAPPAATLAEYYDHDCADGLGENWSCTGGQWQCRDGAVMQLSSNALAEARCHLQAPHFVAEVSLRIWQDSDSSTAGVKLFKQDGTEIAFELMPNAAQITEISAPSQTARARATLTLPDEFASTTFHLLRIELNGSHVRFSLDDQAVSWTGTIETQPQSLALFTRKAAAVFAGISLTVGWQDLFYQPSASLAELGWQATTPEKHWQIRENALQYDGLLAQPAALLKACPAEDYELVINARLVSAAPAGQGYGFLPALDAAGAGPLLTVEATDAGWVLRQASNGHSQDFPLAHDFDPLAFQQFRFYKQGSQLTLQHEARLLGTIEVPAHIKHIGLYGNGVKAAFDMVRVSVGKGSHAPHSNVVAAQ